MSLYNSLMIKFLAARSFQGELCYGAVSEGYVFMLIVITRCVCEHVVYRFKVRSHRMRCDEVPCGRCDRATWRGGAAFGVDQQRDGNTYTPRRHGDWGAGQLVPCHLVGKTKGSLATHIFTYNNAHLMYLTYRGFGRRQWDSWTSLAKQAGERRIVTHSFPSLVTI